MIVVGLLEDLVVDVAGKGLLGRHQLLVHRQGSLGGCWGRFEVKLTGVGNYRVYVGEWAVLAREVRLDLSPGFRLPFAFYSILGL